MSENIDNERGQTFTAQGVSDFKPWAEATIDRQRAVIKALVEALEKLRNVLGDAARGLRQTQSWQANVRYQL